MVDRTDLQQVNMLYGEARSINQALRGFANGGVIVSMAVSAGPLPEGDNQPPFPVMGIPVDTSHITYPPQMVSAIQSALEQRKTAIDAELTSLGLTGVDEPEPGPEPPVEPPVEPAAAAPAPQQAAPPPSPARTPTPPPRPAPRR